MKVPHCLSKKKKRNRTKAKLELIGRADMHYNNWSEELFFFIFYFYNHVCLGQFMNN